MLLFVGLGNPTSDSENNRHNIGFKIIDAINKKFNLSKQKPKFIGKDYSRVRIGIGKPKGNIEVADYVLQNFDEEEITKINEISDEITESLPILVKKDLDLFSSTVNNKK